MVANGYIPATGIWELDAIIYTAAVVTALAVIWRKVLRPIVHAAKRVNDLFDLSDNLTPTVQASLLALPGQVQELHDCLDGVRSDVSEIKQTMQASNVLLAEHMAADKAHADADAARFEAAGEALVRGQEALNAQLDGIKTLIPKGSS